MIVVPVGGYGSGKTMLVTYMTYKTVMGEYDQVLMRRNHEKKSVYSNFRLKFIPDCNQKGGNLTLDDLTNWATEHKEVRGAVFALHEFHEWNDSRMTATLTGEAKLRRFRLNYLVNRVRKRHIDFFSDTQSLDQIDNRIQRRAGYVIACKNWKRDKESHNPLLQYRVLQDPWSWDVQNWDFVPGQSWVRKYGALYDSDEEPEWQTEAEDAFREKMKEASEVYPTYSPGKRKS